MSGLNGFTPEQICEQTGWKQNRQSWLSGFHYGEDRERMKSILLIAALRKIVTNPMNMPGAAATYAVETAMEAIKKYESST